MRVFVIIYFIGLASVLVAQSLPNRYREAVFPAILETQNITFSSNVPQPVAGGGFYEFISGMPVNVREYQTTNVTLRMDVFQPSTDTLSKRPLVIVCFGGGFVSGSRTHWSIRLLCQELAKRGYVAAAIDYRLGMNVFDSDLAARAVYRGLQDGRSAVRFFRANAATYRIDTSQIYLAGHSSGAFIALHNAYLDKESERPISTYSWVQNGNAVADQGCLDCVGNNTNFSGHANSIFSLAGAVGFTSYIEDSNDIKSVMFHSVDDDTVPYTSGAPFGSILWLVVGADLPTVYGSQAIAQRCDTVSLPYSFYSYTDRGHGVHENGSSQLYNDIVPRISNWFLEDRLMPLYSNIAGDTIVCNDSGPIRYELGPGTKGNKFYWSLSGGTFLQNSIDSSWIVVQWNPNAPSHSVQVIPYSQWGARGDTVAINVSLLPVTTNTFMFNSNQWTDPQNWSANQLPTLCSEVVIPPALAPYPIGVTGNVVVRKLTQGRNINLEIVSGAEFGIYQIP